MNNTFIEPIDKLMVSLHKPIGNLLLCRCCGSAITQTEEKTEIARGHQQYYTNPAGITYSISCFGNAPGCDIQGSPSFQDTWFSGYFWQLASCNGCNDHLGWYYQNSKENYFFGLIHSRLIESSFDGSVFL